MNKKFFYLFLALALPGLIFVFLKHFGKNAFDVPVFFESGILADSICNNVVVGQYHVPDTIMEKLNLNIAKAKVVIAYPFVRDGFSELKRVLVKYDNDQMQSVIITGIRNNLNTDIPTVFLDYSTFNNIVTCGLRLTEPWSLVMLDKENRIRGFYNTSRGEMDRLDIELSILLKKY